MIKSKGDKAYQIVCIVLATMLMLCCLYPLLYCFFVSVCSEEEWTARDGLLLFLPSSPTFAAYFKIFGVGSYVLRSLGMALLRTIVGTMSSVLITAVVGYVLSRKDLPGKTAYTYLLLFVLFFSVGLIPTYVVIQQLNLLNSFWVMILPNLINAWNVLVFKQFFLAIPSEIEEAAQVDGTSEIQLFVQIILPMSTAVFASIGLFTMVFHWNAWFDVMIYISQQHSDLWTLQYYIMINFNNLAQIDSSVLPDWSEGGEVSALSTRMALTIVGFLPMLCIYPFFQKYFNSGVYLGAVKG